MDPEAFDRLPEDVKKATLEKQKQLQADLEKGRLRWNSHTRNAVAVGTVAAFLLGFLVDSGLLFLFLISLAGAVSSLFIAKLKRGVLSGILVYGGASIAVILVSYISGLIRPDPFAFLFSWLFFIGAGACVGMMVEQHRMNDTF